MNRDRTSMLVNAGPNTDSGDGHPFGVGIGLMPLLMAPALLARTAQKVGQVLLMLLILLLAACSAKPPGCADEQTLTTLKNMLVNDSDPTLKSAQTAAGDPQGWLARFYEGLKVELQGVVNEGYKSETKKQSCKATLRLTTVTGARLERAVLYSTQKTEGPRDEFLLEVLDVAPFVLSLRQEARNYYRENRWTGHWRGTYFCRGVQGATEGPQGPYAMPVTLVVKADQAKLERLTRGGGVEVLEGRIQPDTEISRLNLRGEGSNSPDDRWRTAFEAQIKGNQLLAEGEIYVDGRTLRTCELELNMEVPDTSAAKVPAGGQAPASVPGPR